MTNEELIISIDEQFPDMEDSDKKEIYYAMRDEIDLDDSYQTTDHSEGE